jgi:hypothetical protein
MGKIFRDENDVFYNGKDKNSGFVYKLLIKYLFIKFNYLYSKKH